MRRRVHVPEREVRGVVFGVCGDRAGEIRFRQLRVTRIARQVTQRGKRLPIVVVEIKNFGERIPRGVFLPQLPLQHAEIHQRIYVRRRKRKSLFQIAVGSVQIPGRALDRRT